MLPLLIKSSKILIQTDSKKTVSDGGECACPCHGMKAVEKRWDRESGRREVKSSVSIWLSLYSCRERNFQKGWCWLCIQALFQMRTPSRTAPRYVNRVVPKHGIKIKLLCSPRLLPCLVKKTEPVSLRGEKKDCWTQFIKKAECSCLNCLKG